MRSFKFLLLTMALAGSQVKAQVTDPMHESVSRCFFVYAPITELGRDLPHPQLFQFGQARLRWTGGYIQANQDNAAFKRVFESNMETHKRAGIQLETSLKQAIKIKDKARFDLVVAKAVECDKALGIRTYGVPTL